MESILTKEVYDDVGFIKDQLMKRKYYGVHTTTTTRRMMMSILVDSVKFRKDILTSENLVKDIKDLVIKNDVIKAADGKHDDCVMSWCIAMYAYYYGEKLERYGFKKGELPDDLIEDEEFQNLEELYKNPLIRAQFPSMVAFYEDAIRTKMEVDYKERKSATLQNIADNDVGSIVGDIIKVDPEYGKNKIPQVDNSGQSANLQERWNKMNRRKQQSQNQAFNPYGTPLGVSGGSSSDDDGSWV
jgi:hypothetical protein